MNDRLILVEIAAGADFVRVWREGRSYRLTFAELWAAATALAGRSLPLGGKLIVEFEAGAEGLWVRRDGWRERHRLPFPILWDLAMGALVLEAPSSAACGR